MFLKIALYFLRLSCMSEQEMVAQFSLDFHPWTGTEVRGTCRLRLLATKH